MTRPGERLKYWLAGFPARPSGHLGYAGLVKLAQEVADGRFFTLRPGQTLSHVVAAHNAANPNNRITVQQLVEANGGLDPTRYIAGRRYKLPAAAVAVPAPAPAAVAQQAPAPVPQAAQQEQPPAERAQDHGSMTNWFWRGQSHPARIFGKDLVRANLNRLARTVGVSDEGSSLISGDTITSMDNDKLNWLRMALQAKGGGTVAPSGAFGGRRRAVNRTTDDYQALVHPGFAYAGFPSTSTKPGDRKIYDPRTWRPADTISNLYWRSRGVPNQIEHTLGDFSWTTDKDGNIIVQDTYDFNVDEGRKGTTPYGGVRRFAGNWASRSTDPDSQKTKFRINLGNPATWDKYDERRFREYNEPYREKFPGVYHYNQQASEQ